MDILIRQRITQIKQHLGDRVLDLQLSTDRETTITVKKQDLPEVCRYVSEEKGGRLLTMIGNDERDICGTLALYYVFAFDDLHHLLTIKTQIEDNDPRFPSVTPVLPAANWYEREVKDLLGLRPQGHPDPRPLVLHGDWPEEEHPLRKEFPSHRKVPRVNSRESFIRYEGEGVTEIPVGPIHAGIIEPGHFRFGAVGDTILHLDARLFYTHRGLEKASEGMPLQKALFLAERICGVCNVSHAVSFAQAVERIGQVEIPERATYLRSLYLELERLYNHIGDVGNICAGFGFAIGISQGSRLREELLQLNERIAGHRYLRGVTDLGGVRVDLGHPQIEDLRETLRRVETEFKELTEIILAHEVAMDRMSGTGVLYRQQADAWQVVGVAARASGRDQDVRRDLPYAAYGQLSFEIPVYQTGDVLARVRVRIDEAFQSFSLIRQLLDRLPKGPVTIAIPPLQPYRSAIGITESARGDNVHWVMAGPDQTIYRYRVRSAAYSNWPAVPLAVKGNIVPDFPLINKSFELCYACCDR